MTLAQFRAALTLKTDAGVAELYCSALTKQHGHDAAALAKAIDELATSWGIAPAAAPTAVADFVEHARERLAKLVGDGAADGMFEAVKKKNGRRGPEAVSAAVSELLRAHGIDPDGDPTAPPAASPLVVHIAEAMAEATATEAPKGDRPQAPTAHEEIIDSARRALAKKIGDDAAEAMFEHITKRHVTPQHLDEAIEELLKAHNIEWSPPESSSPKPEPAATAVAVVAQVETHPAVEPRKNRQTRATSGGRKHRRWSGKLNREVYPHYFPVPFASGLRRGARAVAEEEITTLFAEMPDPALRLYIYGCRQADKDGVFDMSAPIARKVRGVRRVEGTKARVGGDRYLTLLCTAGLFTQVSSGGADRGERRLASEFKLVPYSPELYQGALIVFRRAKEKARQHLARHALIRS